MPPQLQVRRLLAALAGVLLAAITVEAAGSFEMNVGLGRWIAAAAAFLGTLAAAVLAGGPRRWWEWIDSRACNVRTAFQDGETPENSRAGTALILVGFVTYLMFLAVAIPRQQDPWDDDQGAYLQTAIEIRDDGGPGALVQSLYRGDFAEANRHPLYLGLLALRPTFDAGKLISACIGIAGLATIAWLLARQRGSLVAGLFSVLLATNAAFVVFTTRVVCDGLLVVLPGLVWLLSRRRPSEMTWKLLVAIGVLLGLSYLSKGTGLLLTGCTLLWFGVSAFRPGVVRRDALITALRHVAIIAVAFVVVASPLLVRNVRRFGSPFYNVNSLLLFADEYEEFDAFIAEGVGTSEAAERYFATHTAGDMVRREVSGLVWELFIILRSLGPALLDDSRILVGIPIALLAIAVAWAQRRSEHGLLLVWFLGFWVVFAWYVPIAAGERFILPLLVPLLALAAEGVVRLVPRGRQGIVLWAGAIWSAIWLAMTYLSQWPG